VIAIFIYFFIFTHFLSKPRKNERKEDFSHEKHRKTRGKLQISIFKRKFHVSEKQKERDDVREKETRWQRRRIRKELAFREL
jgi:hypothetical protein